MALDFFGVRLEGRIHTFPGDRKGRVIDLWTEEQGTEITDDMRAMSFVSEIRVEHRMGMNSKIQLVLTPPFEDGLRFLNSELIHFGVGKLEVMIGYTTGTAEGMASARMPRLPFTGLIQKPDVQIGEDITITMNALGVGYAMNVTGGTDGKVFEEGTSYAEAVRETLRKYASNESGTGTDTESGIDISELYSHFTREDKDPETGMPFFKKPPPTNTRSGFENDEDGDEEPPQRIKQGPRNDWWFVVETVRQHGLELFIIGDKLYISDHNRWKKVFGEERARKHMMLRGLTDPSRNIYPILSFSSPTSAVWLQPGIGRVVAADIDDNKREEDDAPVEANSKNTPKTRTGDGTGYDHESSVPNQSESQDAGKNIPGNPHKESVHNEVRAEWQRMQKKSGIMAEITTLGIPNLTPGEIIQISGFERFGDAKTGAALFNGTYGVLEVTHTVGLGGYETSFRSLSDHYPRHFLNATNQKSETVEEEEIPDISKPQRYRRVSVDDPGEGLVGEFE